MTDLTLDLVQHQREQLDTTSTKLGRAEGVLDIVLAHIDGTWPAPTPGTGTTVELPASLVDRIRELTNHPEPSDEAWSAFPRPLAICGHRNDLYPGLCPDCDDLEPEQPATEGVRS